MQHKARAIRIHITIACRTCFINGMLQSEVPETSYCLSNINLTDAAIIFICSFSTTKELLLERSYIFRRLIANISEELYGEWSPRQINGPVYCTWLYVLFMKMKRRLRCISSKIRNLRLNCLKWGIYLINTTRYPTNCISYSIISVWFLKKELACGWKL